ncbi:hypothetical protein BCR33DRAFT_857226 [Rhizoclosmatium globosum]|uniref:CoA-dependent acyltransferase n=1 Tax=Rhizoclosmatium globosum TaxID=329046 RepID=A0A1Y2B747_9FUNG|nr:hypothetical protein BCR33DRAFT_857226 [Rhizoclosmatium globosum]|eukprot:ORY30663.1 hypothetical protein BCR33DRAFT_857226 [Rhizoclosmatium globosum]
MEVVWNDPLLIAPTRLPQSKHVVQLGPIAHLDRNHFVPLVLLFEGKVDAAIVQRAVARSLAVYPVLAGRAIQESGLFKIQLDPSSVGIRFSEGFCAESLDRWRINPNVTHWAPRTELYEYCIRKHATKVDELVADSIPLTHVNLVHLLNGFILTFSISHMVADITTCFHFLKSMELDLNSPILPSPVATYNPSDSQIKMEIRSKLDWICASPEPPESNTTPSRLATRHILNISREKLAILKQQASNVSVCPYVSTNDALMGLLWKVFSNLPASTSTNTDVSDFFFYAQYRGMLQPPVQQETPGNLITRVPSSTYNLKTTSPLSHYAATIRQSLIEFPSQLPHHLQLLYSRPEDWKLLNWTHRFDTSFKDSHTISSFSSFAFHEIQFPWGVPVDVVSERPGSSWGQHVICGDPQGGVRVRVGLTREECDIVVRLMEEENWI